MRPVSSRAPAARRIASDTLVFAALLIALAGAILTVKLGLWHANALQADWTYYNNIFWNTNFRDLWLFSYDRYHNQGYPTYLNEHFAPLLLLLAALYQHSPWPEASLLVLHSASPIVTAIVIRAIGFRLLGDRWLATCIALVFAFSPGILWPTVSLVYGFEPDGMLAPCAALAGYGLAIRRDGLFLTGLLIGCGIKENVPAYGVIIGLCLIIFTDRRKLGIVSIAISLALFAVAAKLIPAITGVQNQNINVVWAFLGNLVHLHPTFDYTLPEIGFAAVYCAFFFPALMVLPFLAVIGPDIVAIGQVPWATTGTWHVMLPVAVLGVASVFGTARFLATASDDASRRQRRRWIVLYWRLALAGSLLLGPATLWLAHSRYIVQAVPIDRAALAQAVKLVPPQAGIVTTSDLDQYFAHRVAVTARPPLVFKYPSDFAYLAVNRRVLVPARLATKADDEYYRDACLIDLAQKIAQAPGATVLDRGGILVVRLKPPLPETKCKE